MVVVLVLAAGASWESPVLGLLQSRSGIVVLKRCVDIEDLLATASAGQADCAVLALGTHGLDLAAVDALSRHQVRVVALVSPEAMEDARLRAARIGISQLVPEDRLEELPEQVLDAPEEETVVPDPLAETAPPLAAGTGRIIAVWGPAGAPGRTTVAAGVAGELAGRSLRTTLVDADPYGGAVAQHLGVMDEASGLLAAARLATRGVLEAQFGSVQRAIDPHLTIVSGLPRADRWIEVRGGAVEHLAEVAAAHGHVVVDTGFSLEQDPGGDFGARPARNALTTGALTVADEVIVVGSADPIGLSRLARGLVELRELLGGAPVRVVVNRMRSSLGWSEREIAGMVEGFVRTHGLHFLPDDRPGADKALVSGRTLVESGDSALRSAISSLVDAVVPSSVAVVERRGRRIRRR